MSSARDWLKTLWSASWKGVPFFVEHDGEDGGRRIVVHQFPMRDDPYLEDLGEDKRQFEVTAYVASDSADAEAGTLVAACAARGAGALVLPAHGPLTVRCLTFKRQRSKDRHGYIAFELEFIREGFASALASVASLANLVFIQADSMAAAIAAAFVSGLMIAGQPNFVTGPAVAQAQDAFATLEAVRSTHPVDAAASAVQRDAIQTGFDLVPARIEDQARISAIPSAIVAIARALGDAMPASSAASAFEAIATDPSVSQSDAAAIVSVSWPTPSRRAQAVNAAVIARTLRLAALTAYAESITRLLLKDRPTAITIRANVAEHFEAELIDLPAAQIELSHAIELLRDAVIVYLTRTILDLAPVITIEANLSLPSLFWAWRLYQDPNRSTELVERNRVAHPSFMPVNFEALAR